MPALLRFTDGVERASSVDQWLDAQPGELGLIAKTWFDIVRRSGTDVRELMHDGYATACVDDAPFAYVGVFKRHVNVGFFHGAALPDPAKLLQGTGKHMRHVKIEPGVAVDAPALETMIAEAYRDVVARLTIAE